MFLKWKIGPFSKPPSSPITKIHHEKTWFLCVWSPSTGAPPRHLEIEGLCQAMCQVSGTASPLPPYCLWVYGYLMNLMGNEFKCFFWCLSMDVTVLPFCQWFFFRFSGRPAAMEHVLQKDFSGGCNFSSSLVVLHKTLEKNVPKTVGGFPPKARPIVVSQKSIKSFSLFNDVLLRRTDPVSTLLSLGHPALNIANSNKWQNMTHLANEKGTKYKVKSKAEWLCCDVE